MYTFDFKFYPKSFKEPFIDDYDETMTWFIEVQRKNGQILTECKHVTKKDDHFIWRIIAPEMDSLEPKYYNKYCKKYHDRLMENSLKEFELECIGENYNVDLCCNCNESTHYVLLAEYQSFSLPIICGDCLQVVPLYKFPKTYYDHNYNDNEDYADILDWQELYRACELQFIDGKGERHGYKMMNDPNSALSKEGLRICSFLEKETQKPFYYYLFRWYTKNKPKCPKCGNDWANEDFDKYNYDYICHACRLVSNDMK